MMNLNRFYLLPMLLLLFVACQSNNKSNKDGQETPDSTQQSMAELIDENFKLAEQQYKHLTTLLADTTLPRTFENDSLKTSGSEWWTSGFFPGSLWYLYEYTKDDTWKEKAMTYTHLIEKEQYNTGTHDLGFMLYCSYGNALRLTNDNSLKPVLLTGSKSLTSRFKPTIGCIQSWDVADWHNWQCPVIIDNMMNLELLFWAFHESQDSTYRNICLSHADTTMKNHYRDDYSCYHVVSYDTITGEVQCKQTHQGAADNSAWARGQAWGLYGYTLMYRETKDEKYLKHAQNIARFMLEHPNLPDDKVPYWDFNAPGIPDQERDVSTASLMASALLELSQYVDEQTSKDYMAIAEFILRELSTDKYRAKAGENGGFILKHSVGSKPHNSEVDVPLTYADYYFLEALLRYKALSSK